MSLYNLLRLVKNSRASLPTLECGLEHWVVGDQKNGNVSDKRSEDQKETQTTPPSATIRSS